MQSYIEKHDYLLENFQPVAPFEFYRALFPEGLLEHPGTGESEKKPNGILTKIDPYTHKAFNLIIFDDLDAVKQIEGLPFVVTPPVTFFGKNRTVNHATELRAFAVDLDGVGLAQLKNLFYQVENKIIPKPTYVVNSGHGVHLYYVLEEPIRVYPRLRSILNDFKAALTDLVWNAYTSTLQDKQFQPVYQAFRMPGSLSKFGKGYPVEAFKTGEPVFITYLVDFVQHSDVDAALNVLTELKEQERGLRLTLAEARELYPEWYDRKVANPVVKGKCNRTDALYRWWLRKIKAGATYGHRYHCVSILAACAVKCGISKKQLRKDAMELLPLLNSLSKENPFTQKDLNDALKMYQPGYVKMSRKAMERNSGIPIPKQKRNYRSRKEHLQAEYVFENGKRKINTCRANREAAIEDAIAEGRMGRPTVEQVVLDWRAANPGGSKNQCIRETGLSKPTVYKWWDSKL